MGQDAVLLLPEDPDASAAALRDAPRRALSPRRSAVIISDSFGRAWRRGTVGVAIGAAGLPALLDLRGAAGPLRPPAAGHARSGFADEIAAAASLVMGEGGRGAARPCWCAA